jgi:hypothetical protein
MEKNLIQLPLSEWFFCEIAQMFSAEQAGLIGDIIPSRYSDKAFFGRGVTRLPLYKRKTGGRKA